MKPIRIQRKRTKGWRMPENTVYVGRPSRWGNPFHVNSYSNIERLPKKTLHRFSVDDFEAALREGFLDITTGKIVISLRGKNLACWCPIGSPCHADVLLKIANG